jgi:hypothetical protein
MPTPSPTGEARLVAICNSGPIPCDTAGVNADPTFAVLAAIGVVIAARFVLNGGVGDTATGAPTAETCADWADNAPCVALITSDVLVTA